MSAVKQLSPATKCRKRPFVALRDKLRDGSGASIVIALVFFLICAIVGSVVLTAASVNAKAIQTNREMQQAEFTVGSAAQLVGNQFSSMAFTVDYAASANGALGIDESAGIKASFGRQFWDEYGSAIWSAHAASKRFSQSIGVTLSGASANMPDVSGTVTVDPDLNITVDLQEADSASSGGAYRETVYVQCVPTYDRAGRLIAFGYEPAVIAKNLVGGDAS